MSSAAALGSESGPVAADIAVIEGRSPWRLAFDRLRHDWVAVASAAVIVLIALTAALAPVVAAAVGHGPDTQYRTSGLTPEGIPVGPGSAFLLGTDELGRDVLVRICYGARVSLLAGVVASVLAVAVGVVIGLLAGYFGGMLDTALARFMDVVLSLPYLVFAIALISVVGPGLTVSIAVIAFFSFASVGRVVRGQVLSITQKEFVEAARSLGAGDVRIMFVDILPNVLAPVIVYTTLLIPLAIVFEATLSFLGLGVVPPTASWGGMLSESIQYYQVAWWYVVFPGAALLITTLAFNLLGDSVRDAFDPRFGRTVAR
ncbi:ABC transporter permease [Jatrophihabitans cynanchi]|jgi:peptide/nickel transport system permease protein|uniref:ABC transporter permease n=1 Tax=Jatrophihabitans cynanchi TaxID=2944128 RepID=A0ABY7JW28_9ACTN|nr:ABC transporter permease [Jatrophihabitans sp. SB3-54]WAX56769.1 ABC transporter permease [Jatrophihabitans sp. SB3-54]